MVCTNVKAMQIERSITIDTRKVPGSDPLDAIFQLAWSTSIDDDHAVEEAPARCIEEIDTMDMLEVKDMD